MTQVIEKIRILFSWDLVSGSQLLLDLILTASFIFALVYIVIVLSTRLFPQLRFHQHWLTLLLFAISLPLTVTAVGDLYSSPLMVIQPWVFTQYFGWMVQALNYTWQIGVVAHFLFLIFSYCKIHRWIRRLPNCIRDEAFVEAVNALPGMGAVALKCSGSGEAMASWGLWQKTVLVPDGFVDQYTHEERYYIYLHELSHLRRRDSAKFLATAMFRCLFWFNPLVRHSMHSVRQAIECSCDRDVLKHDVEPFRYAELILKAHAAKTSIAPGFSSQKRGLKTRLGLIVGPVAVGKRRFRDWLLLIVFVAFVFGVGAVGGHYHDEYESEMAEGAILFSGRQDGRIFHAWEDGTITEVERILLWRGSMGYYGASQARKLSDEEVRELALDPATLRKAP
ncbi:MAG: M56 family metallopeptidase [Planctomycetes bacterium]|nr:M56 family metallopeptidase [Planctomycetota bacterium]